MQQSPRSVRTALIIAGFAAAAALVGAGAAVVAQPAAVKSAPVTHVATVNLGKVMDGLTEGKDAKARLDALVSDSKKRLDELNAQIKKIDEDLNLQKKDTPAYRALLGQKLELTATGRAREAVLQQLIDEQEGRTVRSMYISMTQAVAVIAKRDG